MSIHSEPLPTVASERITAPVGPSPIGRYAVIPFDVACRVAIVIAALAGIILAAYASGAAELKPVKAAENEGLYCEEWDLLAPVRDHGCVSEANNLWEPGEADEFTSGDLPRVSIEIAAPVRHTSAAARN